MEQVQGLIDQIGMGRLMALGGFAAAAIVGWKLWKSGQSTTSGVTTPARCTCGWSGQASKHRPICPRCGNRPTLL